uniref:Small ribosomal subunit protein mS29 n=1 Tax=Brassica campestris TaxID=3711 RepID=A0A3P6CCE1_BRACM|nr:unnamed protein product [Brassica rapa]
MIPNDHIPKRCSFLVVFQYNNWFTFSEFEEHHARSCRPIHARELTTVNAFRSMMHDDMMVGAFSYSTAVGKLRKDLPDVGMLHPMLVRNSLVIV